MTIEELLELERKQSELKTKYLIDESKRKNKQDLLNFGIAMVAAQSTYIVMASFAGKIIKADDK